MVFYCNFVILENESAARTFYVTGSHEVRLNGSFTETERNFEG